MTARALARPSAAALVVPDETAVGTLQKQRNDYWTDIKARADAFVVHDESSCAFATERVKEARETAKAYDDERKSLTDPIRLLKERLDAIYRPTAAATKHVQEVLNGKIGQWMSKREAERRAVMAAAAATLAAGMVPVVALPAPAAEAAAPGRSLGLRERWTAAVTDGALVPREFCSPDARKVDAWLERFGPDETPPGVPGLTFTREAKAMVR